MLCFFNYEIVLKNFETDQTSALCAVVCLFYKFVHFLSFSTLHFYKIFILVDHLSTWGEFDQFGYVFVHFSGRPYKLIASFFLLFENYLLCFPSAPLTYKSGNVWSSSFNRNGYLKWFPSVKNLINNVKILTFRKLRAE